MTLFLISKSNVGTIRQFNNLSENKEEFKELYYQVRQEMNDLIVRVNFLLSEDM
ncbi:hypothetical protein JCM19045_2979 [Bacillus sp. JCM 19045]|nr:hypothetical protein JCM19045_2979 [Bacillus sp. JCM 19045]